MFTKIKNAIVSLFTSKEVSEKPTVAQKNSEYTFPPAEQMVINNWTYNLAFRAALVQCVYLIILQEVEMDWYADRNKAEYQVAMNDILKAKTDQEVEELLQLTPLGKTISEIINTLDNQEMNSLINYFLYKNDYNGDEWSSFTIEKRSHLLKKEKDSKNVYSIVKQLLLQKTGLVSKDSYLQENVLVSDGVLDLTDRKFGKLTMVGIQKIISQQMKLADKFNVNINSIKIDKKHAENNGTRQLIAFTNKQSVTVDFV